MAGSLDKYQEVPEQQPDAFVSTINPVNDAFYTILNTTAKVRIISMNTVVTWATTQPTLLTIKVTIDGNTHQYYTTNPVSTTNYYAQTRPQLGANSGALVAVVNTQNFLLEGRNVKIEVSVRWAVTQPTPLNCRVKWAKW